MVHLKEQLLLSEDMSLLAELNDLLLVDLLDGHGLT